MEGQLETVDSEYIRAHLAETWGWPLITAVRTYGPADELDGLAWRDEWGDFQGLIAWHVDGQRAEIVSVDAYQQGRHIGGRLLDGAEVALRERGVNHVSITTTNDNLRALAFYQRRGYRLVKLDLDAMNRVRAVKPNVPTIGLPLRDMIELHKHLS